MRRNALTLHPMKPTTPRRRWLAPILAPAIGLGLLAAVAVGPASAAPALAATPETGAPHGFNIIAVPPRPTGSQGQVAPGAMDAFNIVFNPPRPGGARHETTAGAVDGFHIIAVPPRPTG